MEALKKDSAFEAMDTCCKENSPQFFENNMDALSDFIDKSSVLISDTCKFYLVYTSYFIQRGRGNSTVVSVSVYQAGDPGSRPPRSACHTKVRFYHGVIHSFPPVPTTGSKKAVHVLLCLCNNACKRSLAICRKSRASCPVIRLLSVPIWPACAKQGYDSISQSKNNDKNATINTIY